MEIESISGGDLHLDPANVRRHDGKNLDAIAASLARFGQQKPIVVSPDGVVLAGNGTLNAAKRLGGSSIRAVTTSLENVEATAYAIADNRTAELAEWVDDALAQQLSALQIEDAELLEAVGFTDEELTALVDNSVGLEPEPGEEVAPIEPPENPITEPGDLWSLGDHRLLCGDSTSAEEVGRLMEGRKADLIFTDPPYDLAGKSRQYGVRELRGESYGKLYAADWDKGFEIGRIEASIDAAAGEDSAVYVCTSHFYLGELIEMFGRLFNYSNVCVWSKPNPMPSLSKRHWTWGHEFVMYGTRGRHVFNFPDEGNALSVWALAKSVRNDLHPTQKPIHVPAHAIHHSSQPGQLVADLFCGSGSTLIACDQMDRTCYGMEISPAYCDVIVKRWEDLTGGQAARNGGD